MHYNKLNVTSTSVFCNCKRVHATSASGVVCTNLHSCQVSAPETCVAHQSPCCAVSQVCVFSLRPDYQAHRCLCKTRKRTQPPADGKVIVKPLYPAAADAEKRPSCPGNRYFYTGLRFYLTLPVPLDDRPQWFLHWFSFTFSL